MENDYEMMKELRSLNGERSIGEKMLSSHQNLLAERLRGEMGRDMLDVMSGKKKVELSFKEKFFRKLNWIKKMFIGESQMVAEDYYE